MLYIFVALKLNKYIDKWIYLSVNILMYSNIRRFATHWCIPSPLNFKADQIKQTGIENQPKTQKWHTIFFWFNFWYCCQIPCPIFHCWFVSDERCPRHRQVTDGSDAIQPPITGSHGCTGKMHWSYTIPLLEVRSTMWAMWTDFL